MAETTRLLDAYGQPVSLAELRHEHAAPQVAGLDATVEAASDGKPDVEHTSSRPLP